MKECPKCLNCGANCKEEEEYCSEKCALVWCIRHNEALLAGFEKLPPKVRDAIVTDHIPPSIQKMKERLAELG